MKLEFKSWVPNVTGHLSFSVIGSTSVHSRPRHANQGDQKTRYVLCHERRYIGDTVPNSNFLSKHLFGLDGLFWFACVARTHAHEGDQFGELRGTIFIFRDKAVWRPVRAALDAKIRLLNEYKNSPRLEAIFDDHRRHLEQEIRQPSMFAVEFSLLRTGAVTITADDDVAAQGFENFPVFDNNAEKDARIRSIAAQMFYFLKDIAHTHKHHNPTTDTIVDLHRTDTDGAWCREVLYSLYRKIINEHRTSRRNIDGLNRALGVMAYAEAFTQLLQNDRIKCVKNEMPKYLVEQTKASIGALMTELSIRSADRQAARALVWGVVFGVMGVILAIAALVQPALTELKIQPAGPLVFLGKFILANPRTLLFITIGLVILFNLEIRQWWRPGWHVAARATVVRLAHAFPKWSAGLGLITFGAVLIGAAIWMAT